MANQVQTQIEELMTLVAELQARVVALEAKPAVVAKTESTREMTDDDARRIMITDLRTAKHKDAAQTLGLSYGQVYSCRLEHTFKAIHKEMKAAELTNLWVK